MYNYTSVFEKGRMYIMYSARIISSNVMHARIGIFLGCRNVIPAMAESPNQHIILMMIHIGKPYLNKPANPNPVIKTIKLATPDAQSTFDRMDSVGFAKAAKVKPVNVKTPNTWMI